MESNLHKDTAISYFWLGLVQRDMRDLKGALNSLQKAANITSNVFGENKEPVQRHGSQLLFAWYCAA